MLEVCDWLARTHVVHHASSQMRTFFSAPRLPALGYNSARLWETIKFRSSAQVVHNPYLHISVDNMRVLVTVHWSELLITLLMT